MKFKFFAKLFKKGVHEAKDLLDAQFLTEKEADFVIESGNRNNAKKIKLGSLEVEYFDKN